RRFPTPSAFPSCLRGDATWAAEAFAAGLRPVLLDIAPATGRSKETGRRESLSFAEAQRGTQTSGTARPGARPCATAWPSGARRRAGSPSRSMLGVKRGGAVALGRKAD